MVYDTISASEARRRKWVSLAMRIFRAMRGNVRAAINWFIITACVYYIISASAYRLASHRFNKHITEKRSAFPP